MIELIQPANILMSQQKFSGSLNKVRGVGRGELGSIPGKLYRAALGYHDPKPIRPYEYGRRCNAARTRRLDLSVLLLPGAWTVQELGHQVDRQDLAPLMGSHLVPGNSVTDQA